MSAWQEELRQSLRTVTQLVDNGYVASESAAKLETLTREFPFAVTPYYARLIQWTDPEDPLRLMVTPSLLEDMSAGSWDVGQEHSNEQDIAGVQVKYPSTVLLLPVAACLAYCRFCSRKRLFSPEASDQETLQSIDRTLEFVRANETLDNVLITGGDPLVLATTVLKRLLTELRQIPHIRIIRFGTRALTFLPSRVTSDPALLAALAETSLAGKRIYFVNHFNHPRELTPEVGEAASLLLRAGVLLANQNVLLKGVVTSPQVLRDLFQDLSAWGITPYYTFQVKFVRGTNHFRIPLHTAVTLFQQATRGLNGLAKRSRLIMAHASGKIEILGIQTGASGAHELLMRYHQARNPELIGECFALPIPDDAFWFDDLPGSQVYSQQAERHDSHPLLERRDPPQ